MGNEITIDDLVGGDDDAGGGGTDGPDGDWLAKTIDKLDEKGILEPLIFGVDGSGTNAGESMTDAVPSDTGGAGGLDARDIKKVLLKVYDSAGMIPGVSDDPTVSELVKLIDAHPDLVNDMIQNYL